HPYARFTGTVYFDDLTVQVIGATTSAGNGKNGLPKTYDLSVNYPNPFNPSTNIKFALPVESRFALVIYNILGQRVRTVAEGIKSAGEYTVQWDGRNDVGEVVQTGVYFYRLETNSIALVKKMIFLK
ncbi:MAG: T9SS type A sorting domain-containing protein, partial [Ignavibacteriales bacterium]|nr:T9SS type A sorting domain-containing protein [Ignavibacteriales bacterium]